MNNVKKISRDNAIYIAGLFDGEGSIGLIKQSALRGDRRRNQTFCLKFRIRMTDESIIRWVHSIVGGRFYSARKNSTPNSRLYFEWCVVGRQGIEFLNQIYPFLKVKRLQAETAFEYGKTLFLEKVGLTNDQRTLSDDVVQLRSNLRNRMLSLNQRGVNHDC